MTLYYQDNAVTILNADCREALAALPSGSVQTCITSPPYYGLRDYGLPPAVWGGDPEHEHVFGATETAVLDNRTTMNLNRRKGTDGGAWDQPRADVVERGAQCACGAWRGCLGMEPTPDAYVANLVAVFREVRRALRDDGTLWLNLGDSYAGYHGNKNATIPTSATNGWTRGTNENLRGDKRPQDIGLKQKDLLGIPWAVAFALRADGWYLRSDVVWNKPNPMPESVRDRPTKSHEYLFLLAKSADYFYDADAVREPLAESSVARISQPTFARQTGGPKDYRNGTNPNRSARRALENLAADPKGRNRRSVWTITTKPFKGAHFAVMPPDLVEPCVLAGTSARGQCATCGAPWGRVVETTGKTPREAMRDQGMARYGSAYDAANPNAINFSGAHWKLPPRQRSTTGWKPSCRCDAGEPVPQTVLDPFGGAATVGLVARNHGRRAVLVELNPAYCAIAADRLKQQVLPLFPEAVA
jgi:DNA modification methylase